MSACKDDKELVHTLQQARFLFDQTYPNGISSGLLSMGQQQKRQSKRASNPTKKQPRTSQQSTNSQTSSPTTHLNWTLTNMKMMPSIPPSLARNTTYDKELLVKNFDSDDEHTGDNELEEVPQFLLRESDRLYGYIPDDGYDPSYMEKDGMYPKELKFTYKDIPEGGINEEHYLYQGSGPCLCNYVTRRFKTVLQAYGVAGGFSYKHIKWITAHSNAYASKHLVE
jgi:hypothetical protein